MNLSLCTISFRHHLTSLEDISNFAVRNQFQGIELWGAHAKQLAETSGCHMSMLKEKGLSVSMLSHYLPLHTPYDNVHKAFQSLSNLGRNYETNKLRIFAGHCGSGHISREERTEIISTLKLLCRHAEEAGQQLLIETHPNTLADSLSSTLQLLEEVNHDTLKINFDVLHVWEGGAEPAEAARLLLPCIQHYHFKNIAGREQLHVFHPQNVYAPSGSREGMVPLFEGAVDYQGFLYDMLPAVKGTDISLEWFGADVENVLANDAKLFHKLSESVYFNS
ncbi:TIM barrel protein [Bacillus lacus]|uniref:TIM barrel protein n=1 Tax=Metabacillus lacus TaxID=1983721 RepID=A0A7X2J0L0_9BACI|nr:sugar phosphate isomerase/epimerase [Metabacillus lacus]MRX73247.1 TIM barrel protein [Metabacillus lacus]